MEGNSSVAIPELICTICSEGVQDVKFTCPCKAVAHGPVCNECFGNHITIKITDAYMGTCPVITCPGLHGPSHKDTVLDFAEWSDLNKNGVIPVSTIQKYEELAKSLLSFLCSSCHKMNSLHVPYNSLAAERIKAMESLTASDKYIGASSSALKECLDAYNVGRMSADEAHAMINDSLFATAGLSDKDCWGLIFEKLLGTIHNPERRANLHLRYIRSRPRCWTRCCQREHCFRCRSKDFHEGKSCEEMVDTLDNNMLECPACGIFLVKGDGCNTVTCVCGSQFSWTTELQVSSAARSFLSTHPTNPSEACASALCEQGESNDIVTNATAWRARHKIDTDRELIRWWQRKFGASATQACAIRKGMEFGTVPSKFMSFQSQAAITQAKTKRETTPTFVSTLTAGAESAGSLYESANQSAVNRAASQIDVSVASLFTTMYPNEAERATAAVKVLGPRYYWNRKVENTVSTCMNVRLIASAHVWAVAHQKEYELAVEDYESRMARCFLCIYGSKVVPTPDFDNSSSSRSKSYLPNPVEWCRSASNNSLEFEDPATVKRPGGASCYPAAFAVVPDSVCYFAVRIVECLHSQNTLSFGLAKRTMPKESSDGVGRSSNSWGIHDERGSTGEPVKASSCGSKVATATRKFAVNDVLKCVVDLIRGTCEISLNDTEFVHQFAIPAGKPEDYYFAMTFANDHKVTLIDDPSMSQNTCDEEAVGIFNAEHGEMYRALIVRLRKIITGDSAIDMTRIKDLADKYPQAMQRGREDCSKELLKLQPLISWVTKTKPELLKPERREKINQSVQLLGDESSAPAPLSWQELVYAVSFMTVYKQDIRDAKSKAKKLAKRKARQTRSGDLAPESECRTCSSTSSGPKSSPAVAFGSTVSPKPRRAVMSPASSTASTSSSPSPRSGNRRSTTSASGGVTSDNKPQSRPRNSAASSTPPAGAGRNRKSSTPGLDPNMSTISNLMNNSSSSTAPNLASRPAWRF
jgi:hypothetical protein